MYVYGTRSLQSRLRHRIWFTSLSPGDSGRTVVSKTSKVVCWSPDRDSMHFRSIPGEVQCLLSTYLASIVPKVEVVPKLVVMARGGGSEVLCYSVQMSSEPQLGAKRSPGRLLSPLRHRYLDLFPFQGPRVPSGAPERNTCRDRPCSLLECVHKMADASRCRPAGAETCS